MTYTVKPEEIVITVCANCLRAACWSGMFYCDEYKTANITEKTAGELLELHLEHPCYWNIPDDKELVRKFVERRTRESNRIT